MIRLNDGRGHLYQWDTGRTATVEEACDEVHFSNFRLSDSESLRVKVANGVVRIPDELLQSGLSLYCWCFFGTCECGFSQIEVKFEVKKRAKPADYVFTPTEQATLKGVADRLAAVEESYFDKKNIVHEIGASKNKVMSQFGATKLHGDLQEEINKQSKSKLDKSAVVQDVTGDNPNSVPSQAAVGQALTDLQEHVSNVANTHLRKSAVVQATGDAADKVMSQKAVTDFVNGEIDEIKNSHPYEISKDVGFELGAYTLGTCTETETTTRIRSPKMAPDDVRVTVDDGVNVWVSYYNWIENPLGYNLDGINSIFFDKAGTYFVKKSDTNVIMAFQLRYSDGADVTDIQDLVSKVKIETRAQPVFAESGQNGRFPMSQKATTDQLYAWELTDLGFKYGYVLGTGQVQPDIVNSLVSKEIHDTDLRLSYNTGSVLVNIYWYGSGEYLGTATVEARTAVNDVFLRDLAPEGATYARLGAFKADLSPIDDPDALLSNITVKSRHGKSVVYDLQERVENGGATSDQIQEAVDNYLSENPVSVASVNGKTGAVELSAADVGAVPVNELQTAIDGALQQAKESGEFDGEKGDPGDSYVLTETDKTEIAEQAAALVDTSLLSAIGSGVIE